MVFSFSAVLLLSALGLAAIVILLARHSLVSLSLWRRMITTGLRVLLIVLLLMAVFEVKWHQRSDENVVLFILDDSESISSEAKQWAMNYLRSTAEQMSARDRAGLLIFGEEAFVEIAPSRKEDFLAQLGRISTRPSGQYTHLARAIRLALALFPEGARRRIVLLSDGEENLGDARREAIVAAAGRTPIDVIPLQESRLNDVLIERLLIPSRVQQDAAFDIRLMVQSTQSGPARVRFFQNGHYLGQREIEVCEGKNIFVFPQKISQSGFHTFEARIEALGDQRPENNVATGFSVVQGAPRILYLANPDDGTPSSVPRLIQQDGLEVEVRPRAAVPSGLSELQNYDCLVLDNIPADSFSGNQMRAVERYVHDLGGGLVMIGGRNSFGPGGYLDTPIEEAMPVEMTIKDKRHFPSFALIIVIDTSGSMGMQAPSGKQKIELAAEGAIASLSLLNDQDYIGVLATDTQPKWVTPLRKVSDREAIVSEIASLRVGGGGIYVFTGLSEAYDKLVRNPSMLRHIILFADGQDAEQHEGCRELVQEMVKRNITLTSVALGQGQDVPFLAEIAEMSGGRFHLTEDVDQVPRIFSKETILAQRSYIIEEPFTPVVQDTSSILRGIPPDKFPPLLGYVGVSTKGRSETFLVSHKDDPLLSTWRYGLGKATAFTSDSRARWAQEWVGWDQFGKFWTQLVRGTTRSHTVTHLQTQVEIVQGEGVVTIDALDNEGQFLNFLQLRATILSPSLERIECLPRQTAPGRYEARFPARETGSYMVNVVDESHGSPQEGSHDVTGIAISYPVEFKPGGGGLSLMKELAETTQGRILQVERDLLDVFRREGAPQRTRLPIWEFLLAVVVILLPLDIALRRITLSREQLEAILSRISLGAWIFRRPVPATSADATLNQLKGVKLNRSAKERYGAAPIREEDIARLQREIQQAVESPRRDAPATQKAPDRQNNAESSASAYTRRLLEAKRRAQGQQSSRPSEDDFSGGKN